MQTYREQPTSTKFLRKLISSRHPAPRHALSRNSASPKITGFKSPGSDRIADQIVGLARHPVDKLVSVVQLGDIIENIEMLKKRTIKI